MLWRPKPGRFELAEGGTLFDEIGELDPGVQAKLCALFRTERCSAWGDATAEGRRAGGGDLTAICSAP